MTRFLIGCVLGVLFCAPACDMAVEGEVKGFIEPMVVERAEPVTITIVNELQPRGFGTEESVWLQVRFVGKEPMSTYKILRTVPPSSVEISIPPHELGVEIIAIARARTRRSFKLTPQQDEVLRLTESNFTVSTNLERQLGYFSYHCSRVVFYPEGGYGSGSISTVLSCEPRGAQYHCVELMNQVPWIKEYSSIQVQDIDPAKPARPDTWRVEVPEDGAAQQIRLMPGVAPDASGVEACQAWLYYFLAPSEYLYCQSDGNPLLGD